MREILLGLYQAAPERVSFAMSSLKAAEDVASQLKQRASQDLPIQLRNTIFEAWMPIQSIVMLVSILLLCQKYLSELQMGLQPSTILTSNSIKGHQCQVLRRSAHVFQCIPLHVPFSLYANKQ